MKSHGKYFLLWILIIIAGLPGLFNSLISLKDPYWWRMIVINFSFFSSLTAGLFVWPAIVSASNSKWSEEIDHLAFNSIISAIPFFIFMVWIWRIGNGIPGKYIIRDLFLYIIFWIFCLSYLYSRRRLLYSGILIIIYAIVFSFFGMDMIMSLIPGWKSTVFGGYYFISGLYEGIAAWTLLSILYAKPGKEILQRQGKLIVTFAILSAYLMFTQLLLIWYENIPGETIFFVSRINFKGWRIISYILLFIVYIGPVIFLLTEDSKKNHIYMMFISIIILAGLWVEKWWLISPDFTFSIDINFFSISLLLFFTGITGLCYHFGSKYSAKRERLYV